MLPDHEIARLIEARIIGLTPYRPDLIQPASIDVCLSPLIRVPSLDTWKSRPAALDVREIPEGHTTLLDITANGSEGYEDAYRLDPGDFILACTQETVTLPDDIVGRVEGKSSIGRLGLAVHITAGFIDPGFSGQITLEIANLGPWPIWLRAGMRIAQMAFTVLDAPSQAPYGSAGVGHYMGQSGPVESRYKFA